MSNTAVMPLADYVAACDTIREKTGSTDLIKSGEMADKINSVFEKGKQAEHNKFWDAFQKNGTRDSYANTFQYSYWNDENFNPKYNIVFSESMYSNTSAFEYSEIPDIKASLERNSVTIDCSKTPRLNASFRYCSTVALPPLDLSSCTSLPMSFYGMSKVKSIELLNLRADCVFDRTITNCSALENLTITGTIGTGSGDNSSINLQYSTKLTKESIYSIVNALSTTTTGLSITLSLTSVKKAFETSVGANDGDTSPEWEALESSKTNWIINLV